MPLWNQPSSKIACIKGFVHGIDWKDSWNANIRVPFLEHLNEYDTICWDGDLWNPGSMTDVIKEAMDMYKDKSWVVTIKEKDIHKLAPEFIKIDKHGNELRGYPEGGKIYHIGLEDDLSWSQLGIEGMKIITSQGAHVDVFFLGAGDHALSEKKYFEDYMSDKVTIKKMFPIKRN